jgi:hypothetical protein
MAVNYIWVTTEKQGFHFWANAPDKVGFLKTPHRHLFKFKVSIEVHHNDREIEFFIFKDVVEGGIDFMWSNNHLDDYKLCKPMSLEQMSDWLHKYLTKDMKNDIYSRRDIIIEISEDGENGVQFTYLE